MAPVDGLGNIPQLFAIFHGEVASLQAYGAFVKIPGCKKQGLVHKTQMSSARIEDPSEMLAKGEKVYCKVIGMEGEGEKISLSMKMVNQTTGQDLDPNNVQLDQDSKKRREWKHIGKERIELGAELNTTCRRCGGHGHLTIDCFAGPDGAQYELIPDLETLTQLPPMEDVKAGHHKKKKKKEKKKKKKSKKRKRSTSSSSSSSSSSSHESRKQSKHKKYNTACRSPSDQHKSHRAAKDTQPYRRGEHRDKSESRSPSSARDASSPVCDRGHRQQGVIKPGRDSGRADWSRPDDKRRGRDNKKRIIQSESKSPDDFKIRGRDLKSNREGDPGRQRSLSDSDDNACYREQGQPRPRASRRSKERSSRDRSRSSEEGKSRRGEKERHSVGRDVGRQKVEKNEEPRGKDQVRQGRRRSRSGSTDRRNTSMWSSSSGKETHGTRDRSKSEEDQRQRSRTNFEGGGRDRKKSRSIDRFDEDKKQSHHGKDRGRDRSRSHDKSQKRTGGKHKRKSKHRSTSEDSRSRSSDREQKHTKPDRQHRRNRSSS